MERGIPIPEEVATQALQPKKVDLHIDPQEAERVRETEKLRTIFDAVVFSKGRSRH